MGTIMDGNNHIIFVHGLTEVEVQSMRELLEVFCKDRTRKWLSYTMKDKKYDDYTTLSILLVQPCTAGEEVRVQQYNRTVCIDELPLVPISSEKSVDSTEQNRKKLDESDKVEDAFTTLKPHLEITKQNQADRIIKVVPYCQPRTIQIEEFFDEEEKTADTANPHQRRYHTEGSLTSKDTKYYNKINRWEEDSQVDAASGLIYSLGPPFPSLMLNCLRPDKSHKDLIRFLEHRMKRSSQLVSKLCENQNQFRTRLVETQMENDLFRRQIHTYKEELDKQRKKVTSLESKLSLLKSHVKAFKDDVDEKELVITVLGQQLREKDLLLKKLALEKNLIKQKYRSLLVSETEEISQKMQKQLKIQSELKRHLEVKDKTLKQIKQILDVVPPGSQMPTSTPKSNHNERDVRSGDVTLDSNNGSLTELLRLPSKAWN